ncbi:MAG: hypothetical protein ACREBS_08870, partial [Nitrososphaerales archaeon]
GEREEQKEPPPYTLENTAAAPPGRRAWGQGKKRMLAVILVAIIIAAGISGAFYYKQQQQQQQQTRGTTTATTSTQKVILPLSLGVGFIKELLEPHSGIQILLGLNQTGGIRPYNFSAYWNDGLNQSNSVGIFIRSFFSNQSIPSSVKAMVRSSDGQTATVVAAIPPVNRTLTSSTTTSSSIATFPTITFVESGLRPGAQWSIQLSQGFTTFHSNTTQITLNYPAGDSLSYTISGPYDANKFAWAFVASPRTGTLVVNESSTQINIEFSNQSIFTPTNHLFAPTGPPTASSTGPSSEQLSITYLNSFPDQIQAIVFATVRNSATGSVSIETSTIVLAAFGNQTAVLIFGGLSAGNYSASFFAESPGGVQLSQTTNSTFIVRG